MQPQIITVHDIHESIADVGVKPYANTLVQEMSGKYWYVETRTLINEPPIEHGIIDCIIDEGWIHYLEKDDYHHWYRVMEVPLRLSWFIIDALKLKSQVANIGNYEGNKPVEMSVYLTPGKKIFGHKIEKTTEIPAELRPVVVERL